MTAPISLVRKSRYREIDACLETPSYFYFPKSRYLATTLPSILAATWETRPEVCKQINKPGYPAVIYAPLPTHLIFGHFLWEIVSLVILTAAEARDGKDSLLGRWAEHS